MNSKSGLIFAVIAALVLFLTAGVFAQEFSADMVNTSKDGSFKGKVYVSKEKIRMEQQQSIIISRLDRNVMWVIMPAEKMYMEQPLDVRNIAAVSQEVPGEVERTLLGQEEIDGNMTDKYKVTYSYEGETSSMFIWVTKRENIPVKTMAADGSWSMEYKNLQVGPQPDNLFDIPAGYQKMSLDMPQMGNIPLGLGEGSIE